MVRFYVDGVGLSVLTSFKDHEGFDGVILGAPHASYHLEFTHQHGHVAGRAPTQENLIVFYLLDPHHWQAAVSRMQAAGYQPVTSLNPYWDRAGMTFEDPDGYRVVFQQDSWSL